MQLIIEDDIVSALKAPEPKAEEVLRQAMALTLYAQRALSLGKAARLAHLSLWDFQALLAKEKVLRDYTSADLDEDLKFAHRPR